MIVEGIEGLLPTISEKPRDIVYRPESMRPARCTGRESIDKTAVQ
jgi:hypothetical protein